jgi:hypothetical protein
MGHRFRRLITGIFLLAISTAILWIILSRLFIVVVVPVSFWGLVIFLLIVVVVLFLIIDYIFDIL